MHRHVAILIAVVALLGAARVATSHCEIPCGIYDDMMRIRLIEEDITTVEKSMTKIAEISAAERPDWNQLVRWVTNKETHADRIQETVTQYFMTQRIKFPASGDEKALATYQKRLSLLHRLLVSAMKMKQTTDQAYVIEARKLVGSFSDAYFKAEDLEHYRKSHPSGK